MLVGAVFASNLLSFAAEARGQVVNDGDRFGSGGGYIGAGRRGEGVRVFAIAPRRSLNIAITSRVAISRRNGRNYPPGRRSVIEREPSPLNPPSFRAAGTVRNSQIGCSAFSEPAPAARGETTDGQDLAHRLGGAKLDRMVNDPDNARWFRRSHSGS